LLTVYLQQQQQNEEQWHKSWKHGVDRRRR
jgi:hypothetical protein